MVTTKNFAWSIHSIDLVRDTIRRLTPQVTLILDVLEAPGTRASFTDLHNDIMTRFNGVSAIFPDIKNVIFNYPATIVIWSDNSKTVVKVQDGDEFDPEHGLAMAIVKKMYGNTGKYCEIFKKWIKEEEEDYPEIPSISYDEAMANIKKTAEKLEKEVLNSLYGTRMNELKEKKETGWISTKDRMPDKSGDYLVYDLSSRSVYVYEFEIDSIADAAHWHNCIPHWMPCPAAPNKKGE
jgi:hypothetical protein